MNEGYIDLLTSLEFGDEENGISFAAIKNFGPVFDLESKAEIVEPAAKYFGDSEIKDFKDFGISVIMQMRTTEAWLFSVENPYTISILGVHLKLIENSQTRMTIFYTPNSRNRRSAETLVDLAMPDVTNQWTKLGILVEGNTVSLYQNCKLVDSKTLKDRKARESLVFEEGSQLLVGSSSSGRGSKNFEVCFCVYSFHSLSLATLPIWLSSLLKLGLSSLHVHA